MSLLLRDGNVFSIIISGRILCIDLISGYNTPKWTVVVDLIICLLDISREILGGNIFHWVFDYIFPHFSVLNFSYFLPPKSMPKKINILKYFPSLFLYFLGYFFSFIFLDKFRLQPSPFYCLTLLSNVSFWQTALLFSKNSLLFPNCLFFPAVCSQFTKHPFHECSVLQGY